MTKVFSTRTSGLRAIQAVTTSPNDSRSLALVAEKTFTKFTLSAFRDASPIPDAAASSTLLCTIDNRHRNVHPRLERIPRLRLPAGLGERNRTAAAALPCSLRVRRPRHSFDSADAHIARVQREV